MTEGKLFSQAEELAFRRLDLPAQQDLLLEKYQARNQSVIKGGLVLAGDSLTEFLPHTKLQSQFPVYNRGIRGIGSQFLLTHLKSLVLDLNPSQLLLLIGTNDLMFGMAPEDLVSQIEKIIQEIQVHLPQCEILLQSLYPRRNSDQWGPALTDEIQVTNLYLRQLIGVTFIDVYESLSDSQQELQSAYTRDGVHLTMLGYEQVIACLKQYLV